MMVSGGNAKDGLSKSRIDACGVCSLGVKANSGLCALCGRWFHIRCARVKRMSRIFSRNFTGWKCEGNIGVAVEQEEKLCDEVETVGNSHILVTGCVLVEDVGLLYREHAIVYPITTMLADYQHMVSSWL